MGRESFCLSTRERRCCGRMDLASPAGHPSAHGSWTAAERVPSGRGWSGEGQEIGRGADVLNILEQLVKGHVLTAKRPQGAGGSSRQQDALAAGLAATTVPYSVTRDQRSIHVPLMSAVPLWP